jgi:hypothetical protein
MRKLAPWVHGAAILAATPLSVAAQYLAVLGISRVRREGRCVVLSCT